MSRLTSLCLSSLGGALVVLVAAMYLAPLGNLARRVAACMLVLDATLSVSTSSPTAHDSIHNVTYVGTRASGVEHFLNIFYGEDTAGPNRFAPPVPVRLERGTVIDATRSGAWCPQATGDIFPFTSHIVNVSENCLSLRICRPQDTKPGAKLPVAVWLHGGGHALGSAYEVLYEPDDMVRQAAADGQPIIFVAINYRLGLFGFATGAAMIASKQTNAGLRDQRAALEWVHDNIQHFGGDPHKVTAIGQSVGASDIALHLTSFGGKRGVPFQQAVMMSGAGGLNFNTLSDLVANNTAAIAEEVGCSASGDIQSLQTLQCLREAPVDLLTNLSVTASRTARPPFGEGFFFPTFDGDIVPGRSSVLLRNKQVVKDVPLISSWVVNDGAWYAAPTVSTDEGVLASFGLWLTGLSPLTQQKLLELYPAQDFAHLVRPSYDGPISPQYYRAAQMNRDLWFTCPVLDFTWQYVKASGIDPSKVAIYEHNSTRFTPVFEAMGVPMWRVSHLSDIPYVFNTQHVGGGADNTPPQLELAKLVSRSIVSFVASGPAGRQSGERGVEHIARWPPAFPGITDKELRSEFPSKLSIQLFGGPYGNNAVSVSKNQTQATQSGGEAERAIEWEKLFARCEFINSAEVRAEIGV
ncbi:alpha/beta-hydrolase [Nemania sp. NC0429]|nr:alpha/beta-hydrolase [Nemania sp. NC0429]